jgi:cell wall-associated NlpC family hydrolase
VLAAYAGPAGASPQPTITQVQARLDRLNAQSDTINQQYDQAAAQLTAARRRLAVVSAEAARDQQSFTAMRTQIAQTAVAAYQTTNENSIATLLTASDPQTVLDQTSILTQLAGSRASQMAAFVTAARQAARAQQRARSAAAGITALKARLTAARTSYGKLIAQQQALLTNLTAQQLAAVQAGTLGAGGTTTGTYAGPTGTQAGRAIAFAYAQLGKPYVWGATGPGSYDCSGLVQAAWAVAGVDIPRDTYSQWAALPHVPESAMQPGDLMFFNAEGHVALYVGGGYMIDAPTAGQSVEKIPTSEAWYANSFNGVARP